MRNFSIITALMLVGFGAMSQNPTVSSPNVSPAPALVNGPITIGATFQNQSTLAVSNNDPNAPTMLTFSMVKIKPTLDGNGDPIVSGAGSVFFTWTAECAGDCDNADPADDKWVVRGIQSQPIPGKPNFATTIGGPISFDGTVLAASTPADAAAFNGSGFNLNVTPGAGGDIDNSAESNSQRTFTHTDGTLPVKLVSFSVSREGTASQLTWATTEETNSDYFEVQHSLTGKEWAKIGNIASHGESVTLKNYAFTHTTPVNGENLYRLKMVDKDATYAYSRIQSLSFEGLGSADLSVYPNPVSDKFFIRDFAGIIKVEIKDLTGRSVYQSKGSATGEVTIKNLANGMYIVNLTRANGMKSSQKIVVNK